MENQSLIERLNGGNEMITHIQLNIGAGQTIDEAIKQALYKAEEAKIVSFDFNGVPIALTKDDRIEDILKYWERAIFSEKWYKR